ncbi:MAG: DJ-1/PfpI family protein [Candidatus Nanopelagicales bacterium]|nr:DJ-1/PfpI family protein [Candidatus Nanopelagicales bacterium]
MATVLFVVPPERFRDEELFDTRSVIEAAGYESVVASTVAAVCPGSRGGNVESVMTLDQVRTDDFLAVVFVGGGGSKLLYGDRQAHRIAQEAVTKNLVLGAICLAPVILANAGVLEGVRATVAGTEAETLRQHGAVYTGPGVTVDGKVVTANGPKSSSRFGDELVALLARHVPAAPIP